MPIVQEGFIRITREVGDWGVDPLSACSTTTLRIEVDLAGVTRADSAGLALLLEWVTWANHTVREIRFVDVPARVTAIAKTTEVNELLTRGDLGLAFSTRSSMV